MQSQQYISLLKKASRSLWRSELWDSLLHQIGMRSWLPKPWLNANHISTVVSKYLRNIINIYPEYWKDVGDHVLKEHLKRNFKSYLNKIKEKLDNDVQPYRDCGYIDENIPWNAFMPHYLAVRAWNSLLKYRKLPVFKKRSDLGNEARKLKEITARTGAIPYTERRRKMDDEREANGLMPLTEEEFMDHVYNPNDPTIIALKEKIKNVRDSRSSQVQCNDEPQSPRTQKREMQRNDILFMLEARPPKKGKAILHPHENVAQLVGVQEATKYYANSQKMKDSPPEVDVPFKIYSILSNIFNELWEMVSSLPMSEVTQFLLDVEVGNLAIAAFPDPDQQSLQTHYVQAAKGLLLQILKVNDKFIAEVTQSEKDASVEENVVPNLGEDEDPYAENYPM